MKTLQKLLKDPNYTERQQILGHLVHNMFGSDYDKVSSQRVDTKKRRGIRDLTDKYL